VLRRLAARCLDLEDDGLRFYEFAGIEDPARFKDGFRTRLDGLELTAEEQQALLEEARAAFRLNAAIFEQLVGEASGTGSTTNGAAA
jgi:heme oxygenase